MAFEVRITEQRAGDRSGEVYELIDDAGTVRAEVWPQWGFNCLRWQVRQPDGRWADILYCAGDWETNPVPTRSGHPILFPFPGRMRDGRFTFEGKSYQLPLNDSTRQHAIHGFTPRNRWRVIDWSGGEDSAYVTGQFSLTRDLPGAVAQWPADFSLDLTYQVSRDRLRVDARVENIGPGSLPFGLGYHPYFRLPGVNDADIDRYVLHADVNEVWEAIENLPTGNRTPVSGALDYREPRSIGATQLDYVFTGVTPRLMAPGGRRTVAALSHPDAPGAVLVKVSPGYRDLVLFTPPHRQAVAIEPYTCSADAANLAARGIDSGWQTLPPGETWQAAVEYVWQPSVDM